MTFAIPSEAERQAAPPPRVERKPIPLGAISLSMTDAQVQRRKAFSKEELAELAESIKQHGLVNPILVRPVVAHETPGLNGITVLGKTYFSPDEAEDAARDRFELVAGERRFLAAQLAGLEEIDATVRELTDEQVLEIQLIENLQRSDLHPLHEAEGYEQLMKLHGHTADEIADKVGKSRRYVYARIQLLKLGKDARQAFYEGRLTASTALLVARIPVEKLQKEALKDVANEGDPMPTREAQAHIQHRYMLQLGEAPFPTDIDQFVPGASACGRCPKNTLSQPELFGDVKTGRAGVCTDPICFRSKVARHNELRVEEAKKSGREVFTGSDAKKIFPYGTHHAEGGYVRTDTELWIGGKYRKVSSLLTKDTKTAIVVANDRHSGEQQIVEVISRRALEEAAKAKGIKEPTTSDSFSAREKARAKKAKQEGEVRRKIFEAVLERSPTRLERWQLEQVALAFFRDIWHENQKKIVSYWGWQDAKLGLQELAKREIPKLTDADLSKFLFGLVFCRELHVSGHDTSKPTELLAVCKRLRVDADAIRRKLADAERAKAKAKAAAKGKSAKKKAARKAK